MQQCRAMITVRPSAHEPWICLQQALECSNVTLDDCISCLFKLGDGRVGSECFEVQCKLCPAGKAVCPRDDKLRGCKRTLRSHQLFAGELRHLARCAIDFAR